MPMYILQLSYILKTIVLSVYQIIGVDPSWYAPFVFVIRKLVSHLTPT